MKQDTKIYVVRCIEEETIQTPRDSEAKASQSPFNSLGRKQNTGTKKLDNSHTRKVDLSKLAVYLSPLELVVCCSMNAGPEFFNFSSPLLTLSWSTTSPTNYYTILQLRNPPIDISELNHFSRSDELNLRNVRTGNSFSPFTEKRS